MFSMVLMSSSCCNHSCTMMAHGGNNILNGALQMFCHSVSVVVVAKDSFD